MNIRSLYIKDYNILQDFRINFDSNLSVIIGENGSGKSSVIECLAYIFGHLHKYFILGDKTAGFIEGYEIEYLINGNTVYVKSKYADSDNDTFDPIIKINDEIVSKRQLSSKFDGFKRFFPAKVVLSYSGVTERLMLLNNHFENKFIQKIIRNNNPYSLLPLSLPKDNPFLYIKKEYVSYIILALFVLDSNEGNRVLKKLGIDINGCIVKISLKKPFWAKSNKENVRKGTLWGIQGKIATDFIEGLDLVSVRKYTNGKDLDSSSILTYEFIGNLGVKDLFGEHFKLSADQVVSFLDTLLCDDLLESIEVIWNENFSLDKLSEGEKQLILSVGLSIVLNDANILFLLDEPDASLHPKWQQEFIGNFKTGLSEDSMAIITTHSPNIVSNLCNNGLYLIRKGQIITKSLKYYGKTVENILEDYFGLASTRNLEIADQIGTLWKLIQENKYEEKEFKEKMAELVSFIGTDDSEVLAMKKDILRKKNEKDR